jgi:glutathione S-transferase
MFGLMEAQLQTKTFLPGNHLTTAVITSIYPIESSTTRYPQLVKDYPATKAWLNRMHQRAQFQQALEKVEETEVTFKMPE